MTTDALDRCETTDLLVDQCHHCRTAAQASFLAAYSGSCATCGTDIQPGQAIRETPTGRYEHGWH